jgi:hypothetical protein
MGLPVTVYRSTDVGAPQIPTSSPSEVLDVLQKCLVDGYGSKDSLGWMLLQRDDTLRRIAFKNDVSKGGSGSSVILKSYNGNNTSRTTLWVQSCDSFVNLDNVDGLGYVHSLQPPSSSSSWMLIGTTSAFICLIGTSSGNMGGWVNNNQHGFFAGDFNSFIPNDAGRFIVWASRQTSLTSTVSGLSSVSWPQNFGTMAYSSNMEYSVLRMRDADNQNNYNNYSVVTSSEIDVGSTLVGQQLPSVSDMYSPTYVKASGTDFTSASNDRLGVLRRYSNIAPVYRGIITAFIHRYFGRDSEIQYPPSPVTINGKQHLMLRCGTGGCHTFINIEEW